MVNTGCPVRLLPLPRNYKSYVGWGISESSVDAIVLYCLKYGRYSVVKRGIVRFGCGDTALAEIAKAKGSAALPKEVVSVCSVFRANPCCGVKQPHL